MSKRKALTILFKLKLFAFISSKLLNNLKLSKISLVRKYHLPELALRGILKNKNLIKKKLNSEYATEVKKQSRIQN